MKKILSGLLSFMMLFCLMSNVYAKKLDIDVPKVTDHEKIKVYLFRGESCTHCYDFLMYFNTHAKQFKDYMEIVSFETYKDNQELKSKVNDFLNITDEKQRASVPLIVIGDWYHLGFGEDEGIEIINKALEAYQNDEYVDMVQKTIEETSVANNPETLQEACEKEGIKVNNDLSNAIVLGAVLLVMVGIIVAIAISTKKK